MKKKLFSVFVSLLALIMILSVVSCKNGPQADNTSDEDSNMSETSGDADVATPEYIDTPSTGVFNTKDELSIPSYTFDEKKQTVTYKLGDAAAANIFRYSNEGVVVDGSKVSLGIKEDGSRTVSAVYPDVKTSLEAPTTFRFYLESSAPDSEGAWITAYIGFRLNEREEDPSQPGNDGVWIAIRNNNVGLLNADWTSTAYGDVPYDFTNGQTLVIVDDPQNNKISISVEDNGKTVEIGYVNITETEIQLFLGDADAPAVTKKVNKEVPKAGYMKIWSHHAPRATVVDDFSVTVTTTRGVTDNNGIIPDNIDVFADTWVAIDNASRVVDAADKVANDKTVGIFYFLCHETANNSKPLYDHHAAYVSGGVRSFREELLKGEVGQAHYWAEPYFGYYASDDEWVIRKHAHQLTAAGVDFVYFDTSNGLLYEQNYEAVLRVWSKMRQEGHDTPQICFLCANNENEFASLWNKLYGVDRYEDLWFRWEGKPVILFTKSFKMPEYAANFFTVRNCWADTRDGWYASKVGVNCWPWGDMYPQNPGYSMGIDGKKVEQTVVMCGFWANGSYGTNGGRSYTHANGIPETNTKWNYGYALLNSTTPLGLGFQEQFDHAINVNDPEIIMITGWNEWTAGRWEGGGAIGQTIANEYKVNDRPGTAENSYYVDLINPEYSRDVEAMKGGFGDNYYYQMVENIRRYKGGRDVENAFGQIAIDINGSIGQWFSVGPEYRDYKYDTTHRDADGAMGNKHYTNTTGRNDLTVSKVSVDSKYFYFYAECAEDITAAEGTNWMNLFISTDGKYDTGWNGFDFVLNRSRNEGTVSVERFVNNAWEFEKVGEAEYAVSGNTIQIKVEKSLLACGDAFDFKWADNSVDDGDIMQFNDLGDTAPDGRFCYRYIFAYDGNDEEKIPECLTEDMVVVKANGYNAYAGGKELRIDADNTKAVAIASGYELWLPVEFARDTVGLDVEGVKTTNRYGVDYINVTSLIEGAGKVATFSSDGLIVISSEQVTDANVLKTLYRALH